MSGARRAARERALSLCYELDIRRLDAHTLLDEQPVAPDEYAVHLLLGVDAHRAEIDALLGRFSEHWTVERMPAIDRALLRIGTYELGWEPALPTGVIINEAIELAHEYSTKDSGRFVNGLLTRVSEELRGTPEPAGAPGPPD
jgi:N utilization substance protein B